MLINEIENYTGISKNDNRGFSAELQWWRDYGASALGIGVIGNFSISMVTIGKYNRKTIAVYDTKVKKYAMFLRVAPFLGGAQNCYQEEYVIADKPYRGMNLPVKIYTFMIKTQNMILISDAMQTEGAQSIWKKLSEVQGIGVFGYNIVTHKVFQIDVEEYGADVYDTDLNAEIEYLQQENSISAEEELKILRPARRETREHIRLFAAKTK